MAAYIAVGSDGGVNKTISSEFSSVSMKKTRRAFALLAHTHYNEEVQELRTMERETMLS
jgi:hypothetical protein